MKDVLTEVMYGGSTVQSNIKLLKSAQAPHIIVGTPGRILQLAREKHLPLENLKMFVLDECDRLLDQVSMRSDIQKIFKETPHNKQVMMFTATLSDEIKVTCRKFMRNPTEVLIENESKLTLHGLKQYFVKLEDREKIAKLMNLLDQLAFNQVIIFVKSVQYADKLAQVLNRDAFPTKAIHSGMKQEERIEIYEAFKQFKHRILVATELCARGIDIEKINIVFNYDMPDNSDSYLHRVGRAGRFGTKGIAITFVSSDQDKEVLEDVQKRFEVKIGDLPTTIDSASYSKSRTINARLFSSSSHYFVTSEQLRSKQDVPPRASQKRNHLDSPGHSDQHQRQSSQTGSSASLLTSKIPSSLTRYCLLLAHVFSITFSVP